MCRTRVWCGQWWLSGTVVPQCAASHVVGSAYRRCACTTRGAVCGRNHRTRAARSQLVRASESEVRWLLAWRAAAPVLRPAAVDEIDDGAVCAAAHDAGADAAAVSVTVSVRA